MFWRFLVLLTVILLRSSSLNRSHLWCGSSWSLECLLIIFITIWCFLCFILLKYQWACLRLLLGWNQAWIILRSLTLFFHLLIIQQVVRLTRFFLWVILIAELGSKTQANLVLKTFSIKSRIILGSPNSRCRIIATVRHKVLFVRLACKRPFMEITQLLGQLA